jgi:monoterpene epsilon-lactone hydrolase
MAISSIERRIRASLPIVRFLQTFIPLPLARFFLKQSMDRVKLAADVLREAVSTDGVPCEWVIPKNGRPDQVLLYIHGGGFVLGMTPLHLQLGSYLAQNMGMRILLVDYRLAPDYPFSAALDDCVTAYRWLLKQDILAKNIVVAGDSAGGNLTITLLMKLRDSGSPLPAAAACLSPVTDLTTKDYLSKGIKDPLLPHKAMKFYTQSYVGHNDAHEPLISPVFGNLRGLPPLLVHVGEDEILRDDAVRIASLARSVDVDVRLEIYSRMWHVWQLFLALPQAVQSLGDIAQFLKSHLGYDIQQPSPS